MQSDKVILGIETSCDETSAAVMTADGELLSNIISSQIEIHRRFGGVVPEIASRNHVTAVIPVIEEALVAAGKTLSDVGAVAVTYGAGLVGALLVGVSAAKSIAYALRVPLYAINHIEAHIAANYISEPSLKAPFLAVVASGGHTGVARVDGLNKFSMLASTTDDAIGEAFDKVARALGLPYPGGPEIDKLAKQGEPNVEFISHKKKSEFSLSYSGLKTAVINYLHNLAQRGETVNLPNVCASFQTVACDMLINSAMLAVKRTGIKKIVLAGGVAANSYLRKKLAEEGEKLGCTTSVPPMKLCTDNAAMVCARALGAMRENMPPADLTLNAASYLKI